MSMQTTRLMTAFVLGFASLVVAATAPAQSNTSGKVSLESKAVALGAGVSWGEGTLTYRGKQHKFSVEGLSVLDLGVSKVSATGEVSDLKKLEDFAGTYAAAGAGAAAGGGAGVVALTNQNGVKMKLQATAQGVRLTAAGAGVTIKLKN
jgi:hypothetical protein